VSTEIRSLADAFYKQVVQAIVNAVEAHAAVDAKHGPRVQMENYAFLRLSLQGLPLSNSPVLHTFCSEAASRRNAAVVAYVDQLAASAKLVPVLQLSAQLGMTGGNTCHDGTAGGTAGDGDFAAQKMSASEAKQVVSAASVGLEKRLARARQRVVKHFGGSSPYLITVVWER